MTTTTVKQPSRNTGFFIWLGALGLLLLGLLITWINQIVNGLVITDMRNVSTWGLYIVGFMFFVGLSAGGLIISAATRVFNATQFKPIAKIATLLSFACIVGAGTFILPDIGRLERIWHMAVYPNWTSPLLWDVVVIILYMVLSAVYLWMMIRAEQGKVKEGALKIMAFIALPAAILVHSVTAWIFGLQISRPFWHSALMAPMFISSALVSGLGLLILVLLILQAVKYMQVSGDLLQSLRNLLATFIIVDLFFLFSELLTSAYPQSPEDLKAVMLLLTGANAPLFWIEVIGGVVAVVLLLNKTTRQSTGWLSLATVLAIIGIFFKRFNLLMAGFVLPLVENATVMTGPASPNSGLFLSLERHFEYFPSTAEWMIAFGVVALSAAVFTLGTRFLPLKPETH